MSADKTKNTTIKQLTLYPAKRRGAGVEWVSRPVLLVLVGRGCEWMRVAANDKNVVLYSTYAGCSGGGGDYVAGTAYIHT